MRSRTNGGIIGSFQLPHDNYANGAFYSHDAAVYNTVNNPIWPLPTDYNFSATGGTIAIANDNPNYKTHTFTANGTFTVTSGTAYIEILVVGGGGSGGAAQALDYAAASGGGGGGMVLLAERVLVTPNTVFTVVVGRGGSSVTVFSNLISGHGAYSSVTSNNGHSYMSYGGGYGGFVYSQTRYDASSGGSGGGGGYNLTGPIAARVVTAASSGSAGKSIGNTPGKITTMAYAGASGYYASGHEMYGGGGGGAIESGNNIDTTYQMIGYGGDGYYWPRTGLRYGAGGGAQFCRLNGGVDTVYNAQSGLYGANTRQSTTATTSVNDYGLGGPGRASTGTLVYGGPGGSGTVIFCYRFK